MGRLCYPTQFRPTSCPCSLVEDFFRPEKEGMPAPQEQSGGGGALFAVFQPPYPPTGGEGGQVQILLSTTRVAPAPLLQIKSGGTSLIGAVILSLVTKLIAGSGSVSRYKLPSKLEICHDIESILLALARSPGTAI